MKTLTFGPIPSRRLGQSLGINNIPPNNCSYSCIYCQIGRTTNITTERRSFYKPEDIFKEVKKRVDEVVLRNGRVDYLSFVPNGEPTLDINLGTEISLLKQITTPIAVLTNASLIWREDVKEDLLKADAVSLKVDAVSEDFWRKINRRHKALKLAVILDGITDFVMEFKGKVFSETMLIDGMGYRDEFERTAEFLKNLKRLDKAYITTPTRPPAEEWVKPVKEKNLSVAFQTFSEKLGAERVECLIGYEGNAFAFTGRIEVALLSIMSVHPMRAEAVKEFLKRANSDWYVVDKLLRANQLREIRYEGNIYYVRKLPPD